ncbi:Thyrotropin-releasing hormone receptor [Ooceraea biroi]|uniref:Thyrotropin-releasing hormone receptor n=1 Tax=Ooceraea biroi TaxID=2015173 RepID=A0A026VY95_OOCBI|nr:Thyrotropin-releasing hormone receptor [Ooceraea biroi]
MVITNQTYQNPINLLLGEIYFYYTPILVNLGLVGNCLSVFVFFGTKLRHSSSSIYLGALAISDIGFLITIFMAWLTPAGIDIFIRSGFCQFFMYLGSLCSFLSVWFVVAFTVERFVAVRWPLRRQSLCTVTRAKATVIKLTVVAAFWCSPVLLFTKTYTERSIIHGGNIITCDLNSDWKLWANIHNSIDAVLTFVLPFVMIVIFNTLIARNIYRFNRTRRTLTIESDGSNKRGACSQSPRDRMPQIKVTKMLLLVSTTFFCLYTPSYVVRVITFVLVRIDVEV